MWLWILRPIDCTKEPWNPWYDRSFGFVVRAAIESEAREEAAANCGDEGKEAWLSAELSTCLRLTEKGETEIIIKDFASA